ncbi:MAG: glucose dehydrogenase [Myxococcaceae bacterium]|nr:glucose dehydrogenase [Myxococcaceae bacterium]
MSERIERVIITGASSGIGFDLAKRFLREGSRVLINGRDPEKLERARLELGSAERVFAVAGHVGDPQTALRLARAAEERLGGADVLVNNAGIFLVKPFLESSDDDLTRLFETNVRGTFSITRAVAPLMIAAGQGVIINVGTVLVEQPNKALPASAAMASKGAVHALTRSLALELAPHRVRVNAVAPGIIRTPLIGPGADSLSGLHPLGRVGEVDDTSDAVLFLARAGFITGAIVDVDGGYAHGR